MLLPTLLILSQLRDGYITQKTEINWSKNAVLMSVKYK